MLSGAAPPLRREDHCLMLTALGWAPGGQMPDPLPITRDELAKLLDAARAESQSELLDMLAAAYEQGCRDVHANYEPGPDPEFGEAAHDYALSAISRAEGLSVEGGKAP